MKTPRKNPLNQSLPNADDRNARLKAALQANIARRKAQAKAQAQAQANTRKPDEAPATDVADNGGED